MKGTMYNMLGLQQLKPVQWKAVKAFHCKYALQNTLVNNDT